MGKEGVIIIHGCGHKLFVSRETLENNCAILCSGCKSLISLSLFGSTVKRQLLNKCEKWTDEEINEKIKEV